MKRSEMFQNLTVLVFAATISFFPALGANAAMNLSNDRSEMTTEFEVAPEISSIKYEEPNIATEKGLMYGISGAYTTRFPEKWVLGVDGRFSVGQVDYDSNGTGSIDNIWDYIIEVRGTAGYDLQVLNSTRVTPYLGLGYRFLRDELGGEVSTTNALGYDRQSAYFYLPIGVKTMTPLTNEWFVGLNVEYDIFLDGTQKSELGDAIAGLDTLENDQDQGYGVRGSIQVVKSSDRYDFFIEPFIRYWNIKQSDTKAVTYSGTPIGVVGYEPKNNSTEIGAKLGMHF